MTAWPEARSIPIQAVPALSVDKANRSADYAARWLRMLGVLDDAAGGGPGSGRIVILAGDQVGDAEARFPEASCLIRLWDFQVGRAGTGGHASAVSGAATVIGVPGRPPVALPVDIPEKWCGAYGAILALSEIWRARRGGGTERIVYDVSAADVLRVFALQNAGTAEEMSRLWRRNGRVTVEHGGIFPMGFFACRDGYVALLGRSRRDWVNIRKAIGDPAWAETEEFANPFKIAADSARADELLQETLQAFSRDELLQRGLEAGAVIAPVFSQEEAQAREIFRADFATAEGPALPFLVDALPPATPARARRHDAPTALAKDLPLAGLRCIELCWVWSGPLVGQILADLGAEVIKLEWRSRFDLYRTRGLEALRGSLAEATRIESSLYFHSLNRNKVGMTVDLKHERGLDVVKRLAARSDLLIENFTVGTLERLGLGPEVLSEANPALVALSMSGPGRGSTVQNLRSYGLVLSALGGAEHLIRDDDGEFLGSPTFSLSDPNAAVFGALAALAGALAARDGGRGFSIDVSQIEAAATLIGTAGPALDAGHLNAIVATNDGRELALRVPADAFLDVGALKQWCRDNNYAAVLDRCRALGGEAAEVCELDGTDAAEAFADCSGWLASSHPFTGDEMLVAAPWRIDGQRSALRKTAPLLGEGNDYVLRRVLEMSDEEIASLVADGVV